jgi:3-dehydroquinate synthetase
MLSDKKVRAGAIRFILPTQIGDVTVVVDVSRSEFGAAWDEAIGEGVAHPR